LEGCWQVSEAEEHDCRLKKSLQGKEGSLPFVPILNTNIIVSPVDVELGEQSASTKAINGLGNERGNVLILFGPFVDQSIVLNWS
jgi:hypothetical protein